MQRLYSSHAPARLRSLARGAMKGSLTEAKSPVRAAQHLPRITKAPAPAKCAHSPSRTVSHHRVSLKLGKGLCAHAAEIIIRSIIFANVIEAKTKILTLAKAPHGRTKF